MFGHVAKVAMCTIILPEFRRVRVSDFSDNFCELRAADAQDAFIAMRKRPASQEDRSAGGVFQRQRFEKFAYQCDFGDFFGGCGYRLARLYEPAHELSACALHPHRLATWAP